MGTEQGIRVVAYAPGQFGAGRMDRAVLDSHAQSDVGPVPYSPFRCGDDAYPLPTVSTEGIWVDEHRRRGNDLSKLFLPVGDVGVGAGHPPPGSAGRTPGPATHVALRGAVQYGTRRTSGSELSAAAQGGRCPSPSTCRRRTAPRAQRRQNAPRVAADAT